MKRNLFRDLKFWTIHGVIAATPSFVFAIQTGWDTAAAYAAMILGVLCIIAAYTLASSWGLLRLHTDGSAPSAILRWAVHIRAGYALVSLLGFIRDWQTLLFLDIICGTFGVGASQGLLNALGFAPSHSFQPGHGPALFFLQTWLCTVFTGMAFSIVFFIGVLIAFAVYGVGRLFLRPSPSPKGPTA